MFEVKVHALAAKHGKRVQTWHDAFVAVTKAGHTLPSGSVAQVWMGTRQVSRLANGEPPADAPLLYTTPRRHVKRGHPNTDGVNNVLSALNGPGQQRNRRHG